MLLSMSPREFQVFIDDMISGSHVQGSAADPKPQQDTRMPSSCFGCRSIFKVTFMKTSHGKCTEQSLNLERMHGSLHYYK